MRLLQNATLRFTICFDVPLCGSSRHGWCSTMTAKNTNHPCLSLSRLQQSRVYPFSRVRKSRRSTLLFEAGAILILAFASVVINYRRNKDDGHPSE